MDNESQHEANKVLRVLKGERLKYTVRINMPDGTLIEFQSENIPKLDWNTEARALWLTHSGYGSGPIMRWPDGAIMLTEENKA